jgi:hypothetical protein
MIIQLKILNIHLQIQKKTIVSITSRKRAFSEISSVEKAIDKLSKISSENKVTDNEFDYFAKSVAVQLINMPRKTTKSYERKTYVSIYTTNINE